MTARFDVQMPSPVDPGDTVVWTLPSNWDEKEAKRFAWLLSGEYGSAQVVVQSRAVLARYER